MRTMLLCFLAACALAALPSPAAAQSGEANPCPMHEQHMKQAQSHGNHDAAALDARGDKVMGFEHSRTTHHFRLAPDGGAIEVEVTDPKDAESLGQIRGHLAQVAREFSQGQFGMPREIHGRVLPGVEDMQRLKDVISYRYEETERGARVRIASADPAAREAVQAFLRSQIEDHRTGDPLQ